jgi:hypothetical protein
MMIASIANNNQEKLNFLSTANITQSIVNKKNQFQNAEARPVA